jgi:L-seryl-tRNA(Ser) seleniumtransferase
VTRQRPSSTQSTAQEIRTSLLRAVPPVDECLRALAGSPHARGVSGAYLKKVVQQAADDLRAEIDAGRARNDGDRRAMLAQIVRRVENALIADEPAMKPLVNATGVVLHTNLGRAILAEPAIEAVEQAARAAVNLEFDLQTGERGDRDAIVETELCALTGAEAATVVNNNAAAVLLVLNTLALGREVVVSRGELIEIGGSFRIPDVMLRSGARLHEVGTTNRTHRADYRNAIGPDTALLMKVHPSNYQVIGFTSEVALQDLAALGREYGVDVVEDLGSGALIDLTQFGLPREPVVAERIAAGAAIVTFSGDKLLGGPQAGLIVGRRELIAKLKANPLKRALRCDKLTLAALAATLRIYLRSDEIRDTVPTLRLMSRKPAELRTVAAQAAQIIAERLETGFKVEVTEATSQVGSGSLPAESLPSVAVTITHPDMSANAIAARFRRARIIGRVSGDAFHLDMRTIEDPAVFAVDFKS